MKTLRVLFILSALILSPAMGDPSVLAGEKNENPLVEAGWFCPFCGGSYDPYDPNRSQQGTMRKYHHWMGFDNREEVLGPYKTAEPIDKNKATQRAQSFILSTKNPNLKLGGIVARDNYYEALIVTREGSLVDILIIDKYTGLFRSIY